MPFQTQGYAAQKPTEDLKPWSFERRDVGPNDVHLKIKYCGVCHSDIHSAKGHWDMATFPCVPGHEIVGIVEAVGNGVTKFKKGDIGAVGCVVDSCLTCSNCKNGEENYCPKFVLTYSSIGYDGLPTYGGYSRDIIVKDHFVFKVPQSLKENLAGVAPLLCAGITTWSPMKHHGMDKPGKKIGVIGLGGLGHMVVKFGVAFGNEVTVISTSENKRDQAINLLGATNFIVSKDPEQMKAAVGTLDFIVDCVSADKDMNQYLSLLRTGGTIATVAAPPSGISMKIEPLALLMGKKSISGSAMGGMKEHQDMLDFCGEKGITSMIEIIKMNEINEAYKRMEKSDVRYRFVIDMDNSDM